MSRNASNPPHDSDRPVRLGDAVGELSDADLRLRIGTDIVARTGAAPGPRIGTDIVARTDAVPGPRIGTDIVAIAEIRESIDAHGERYLQRVYTDIERADCGDDPVRLAARFAAKEAFIKALRIANLATPLREMSTELRDGMPILLVSGTLAQRLDESGLRVASVSLSHTDCHAVATVLLTT